LTVKKLKLALKGLGGDTPHRGKGSGGITGYWSRTHVYSCSEISSLRFSWIFLSFTRHVPRVSARIFNLGGKVRIWEVVGEVFERFLKIFHIKNFNIGWWCRDFEGKHLPPTGGL